MMSTAAIGKRETVPEIQFDITRLFQSDIGMFVIRTDRSHSAPQTLGCSRDLSSSDPKGAPRPYRGLGRRDTEILEEALRCGDASGMALEPLLDHVRNRR